MFQCLQSPFVLISHTILQTRRKVF